MIRLYLNSNANDETDSIILSSHAALLLFFRQRSEG